jgi:protein gp37
MGEATNIEWCDTTTNPVMGCRGCELWVPEKNIRRC